MKIFSATFGDAIRFDQKPNEDAFLVSEKAQVFAVADGVTQAHFADGSYAYPNGAKESANIFCRTVVGCLEETLSYVIARSGATPACRQAGGNPGVGAPTLDRHAHPAGSLAMTNTMSEAFDRANEKIMELNIREGIDKKMNYVEYDWFDTVGVAGVILNNKLYYGFVGDCGLAVYSAQDGPAIGWKKVFQTEDMVAPAVARFREQYKNYKDFSVNERMLIMHRDFRNNPNMQGYGSFSGEEGVKKYYAFGSRELGKGDMIVLYSDGIVPYLEDENFIEILKKGDKQVLDDFVLKKVAEDPQEFGDDRTFISVLDE